MANLLCALAMFHQWLRGAGEQDVLRRGQSADTDTAVTTGANMRELSRLSLDELEGMVEELQMELNTRANNTNYSTTINLPQNSFRGRRKPTEDTATTYEYDKATNPKPQL